MPPLDLALGLGMHGGSPDVIHALVAEPACQISRDVTGTIVTQQPGLVNDIDRIQP